MSIGRTAVQDLGVLVPSLGRSASTHECTHNRTERPNVGALEVVTEQRRAFFTPKSLAVYLALSERTVREMLRNGVVPSYRIEGARRIDPRDVDSYLAARRKEAA